ncbi:hypothetical protein HPP92_022425 [Vanilla planifolia]|uniref:Uncharacterized protein n=1 Tax=Vanilla planifolia TaxID=51239 RepID=A0A835Q0J8_VANPL|nr:hypothetical protein HPP92_022425 [Vanilla planifolia]
MDACSENAFLLMAVGSFIATDLVGILVEDARKHLNNVVFYLFTPAFVTNNLSQTFTLERLTSTWFLPINILLTFAIGSAFGWILVKVTRPPSHLKPILVGCCASGNLGIMLFIVIPNTCTQKGSPFGDPNTCSKQAFAYSSLSSGIYDLIFWSYVYNIVRLSIKGGEMNLSIEQDAYAPDPEKGFELSIPVSVRENLEEANNLPMAPTTKRKALILWKKMEKFSHSPVMVAINRLFTPSIVGAVLGLIVGVVSPLRKTFIGENAPFV